MDWQLIDDAFMAKMKAEKGGWLLVGNDKFVAPVFLGYGLFRKEPRWCSVVTHRPLIWTPTHYCYVSPPETV